MTVVRFLGVLEALSHLHDVVHVDARLGVEGAPHYGGQVEEESLEEQDDRHPLVVKNHLSSVALPLLWDVFLGRQIVRVSYPAVVVGVILVVLREHRRYPAVDRLANELHLADDHRERNQNARRVLVVQTIREIIVVAGLRCRDALADDAEYLIHGGNRQLHDVLVLSAFD